MTRGKSALERMAAKLIREEQNEAYRQERAHAAILAKAMKEAELENYRLTQRGRFPSQDEIAEYMLAHGGDK